MKFAASAPARTSIPALPASRTSTARDQEQRRKQLAAIKESQKTQPPAAPVTTVTRKQATHEKLEELNETADVLTYDEAVEELKKIKEQEKI
jgi:hypothetical protein